MNQIEAIATLRAALESTIPVLQNLDTVRHVAPEFPALDNAHEALRLTANLVTSSEPVGEVVNGAGHIGWYVRVYKPWDDLGAGTKLYVEAPPAVAARPGVPAQTGMVEPVDARKATENAR